MRARVCVWLVFKGKTKSEVSFSPVLMVMSHCGCILSLTRWQTKIPHSELKNSHFDSSVHHSVFRSPVAQLLMSEHWLYSSNTMPLSLSCKLSVTQAANSEELIIWVSCGVLSVRPLPVRASPASECLKPTVLSDSLILFAISPEERPPF